MPDIFDTDLEKRDVKIEDNTVKNGDDINITAKDPTMHNVKIGLGWSINAFDSDTLDLDASCFLLDKDGKTRVDEDFVFYNNEETCEGAVIHNGDSRTGAGEGDDELITLDLHGIPFDVVRVLFTISIYQPEEKEQNIGMVRNAYLRLINADTTHELFRYKLEEALVNRTETAMVVAALDREGPKWHFKPLEEFIEGGLPELATSFGIIVQN